MSNTEKGLFWLCVILTMAMAFTALMISLPRTVDSTNPTSLDYQGTIVTAFSVIVAVLLGWQIFSTLSIDRRIYKAEKRIVNMLSQLQATRKDINITAKSSEDYTSGVNCLSVAMIEYVQTLYNRTASTSDRAKHYCTCYMVSAQAIRHLLDSKKNDELLYPIFCLCVEGLKLSSDILFTPKYLVDTKREFTRENHRICNGHYKYIMNRRKSLGIDNLDLITEVHNKRIELLKP